jgi:hypothetical protein
MVAFSFTSGLVSDKVMNCSSVHLVQWSGRPDHGTPRREAVPCGEASMLPRHQVCCPIHTSACMTYQPMETAVHSYLATAYTCAHDIPLADLEFCAVPGRPA